MIQSNIGERELQKKIDFQINNWNYYKNSIIPSVAPHEEPDLSIFKNKEIWKNKNILFARYTTDFDCPYETGFYGCLKDDPFDLNSLKAKRRYEINKGVKNFTFRRLTTDYLNEMYDVYLESLKGYDKIQKPQSRSKFCDCWGEIFFESNAKIYGVVSNADGRLCGFTHICENGLYIAISTLTTRVDMEKHGVNFALVYGVCMQYDGLLKSGEGYYLWDGYKNILHETNFQEWLIKYFGFRKAYCRLNIIYRPSLRPVIRLIFLFRNIIKGTKNKWLKKVYALLKMEELRRK